MLKGNDANPPIIASTIALQLYSPQDPSQVATNRQHLTRIVPATPNQSPVRTMPGGFL